VVDTQKIIGLGLRTGVIITAALIILGVGLILANHSSPYTLKELINVSSNINTGTIPLHNLLSGIIHLNGVYIILLGLIILIATPIFYVVVGILRFSKEEKDPLYIALTIIVLFNLFFAIFALGYLIK